MQVLPGTWDWVNRNLAPGPLDPASAADNVRAGSLYLAPLLRETGGDERLAAAGYYQGLASVRAQRDVRRHAALRRQRARAARALRRIAARAGAVPAAPRPLPRLQRLLAELGPVW